MSAAPSAACFTPGQIPTLGPADIHVWRIRLDWPDSATGPLKNCLTAEESERAKSFHFARHQRRFIVRRGCLRQLLAVYLGRTAERIGLQAGPFGKPFIPGQEGPEGIRFSCSHSGDLGLIAISRGRELGADLEQHREMPDAEELAADCFSAGEIKALGGLPAADKTRGFFNAWARKEAFVKATGLGLSYPLNRFSVSLAPGQPAALLEVEEAAEAGGKWTLIALEVSPNYSAALVFAGRSASLRLLEWNPPQVDLPGWRLSPVDLPGCRG